MLKMKSNYLELLDMGLARFCAKENVDRDDMSVRGMSE